MKLFTPKNIILSAVKDKLIGTGIEKLTLVFNVMTEKYNVIMSNHSGQRLTEPLSDNEMNIVKKVLVSRVMKHYPDIDIAKVIVQINVDEENKDVEIGLYIEDKKSELTKIEI